MRVSVDQDKCAGSGQCVMSAERVFDQREEDGVVVLVAEVPPAGERENVLRAARWCPTSAITVTE